MIREEERIVVAKPTAVKDISHRMTSATGESQEPSQTERRRVLNVPDVTSAVRAVRGAPSELKSNPSTLVRN